MKPKKVLFLITKATWGGAQRYVYDLATHLPQDQFTPIVAFGEPGRLQKTLTDAGIGTRHIPALGRDVALLSDLTSFFQILACVWRVKPDVIHLNSSKAAALGALAARALFIPKIIFTVHGWPFKEDRGVLVRKFIYFISWFTALLSNSVIVVSKEDESIGKRMALVGRKIHYIPIGIEPPKFLSRDEASTSLSITAAVPRIVTIAELTLNKGVRYAIDAIAILKSRGIEVSYFIISDGEERAKLEALAHERNVSDRVHFLGFVQDVARCLKAFDVFLLPSIKEGMPYVLLEAAAANLPIITTNVVNPDVVDRYENIRAVPPANPEALAEALIDVMRERSETELFPSRNHFSLSDMLKKTTNLY